MKRFLSILIFSVLLTSCSFSFNKQAAEQQSSTSQPTPSRTPALSIPTATSTTTSDFSGANVANVEYLPDDQLRVIIFPSIAMTGQFRAVIAEMEFACEVPLNDPDRMHCIGPEVPAGRQVIRVFRIGEAEPLFSIEFMVPSRFTSTPSPTPTYTSTPTLTLATAVPPSAIPLPTRSGPYNTPVPDPDPYPEPDTPVPPSPYP